MSLIATDIIAALDDTTGNQESLEQYFLVRLMVSRQVNITIIILYYNLLHRPGNRLED